jgi:uncharacterized membrane protein HdeD (DUF308 family)
MIEVFARNWGLALLRGIVTLALGIYIIVVHPVLGLASWILIFGVFSVVKGAYATIASFLTRRYKPNWLEVAIDGPLRVAVGIITLTWPRMDVSTLLHIIGAWSFIRGISHIAAAVGLRRIFRGAWLLHIAGALAIGFGVLLFTMVDNPVVETIHWVGVCLIAFGVIWIAFSLALRRWLHENRAELDA